MKDQKLLYILVAGLDHSLVERFGLPRSGLSFRPLETVFPALTCPVQASVRTGVPPREHGMRLNGVYLHELASVQFWEQSSRLIPGPRIWDGFRERGGQVGMWFWQQSLGEEVDSVLSPRPIHKHSGGMIQNVYARPRPLLETMEKAVGRPFKLQHYWGPVASSKASDWIVAGLEGVLQENRADGPDWIFSYLPHLDYTLQRLGPQADPVEQDMGKLDHHLERLMQAADQAGYQVVVHGDYSIEAASQPVYPNRALKRAGFFHPMEVRGRQYMEFFDFDAFAIVDHQVALVPVRNTDRLDEAAQVLMAEPGVETVERVQVDANSPPKLLVTAEEQAWFAYPWWDQKSEAPDYAGHVDIHNKPGFDPCELFFGWPPGSISQNPARIQGTHGRIGPGREIAWADTFSGCAGQDSHLLSAVQAVQTYMER